MNISSLAQSPQIGFFKNVPYLWQIDIWHNHAVQSTGGILWRVLWVSTRVVLVLEVVSCLISLGRFSLPWHTALSKMDMLF